MNNLKKIRGVNNLSQKEMAEKLGISRQMYNNLENGKNPNSKVVSKICEEFNITPCELLGINNLKFKPENKSDFEMFIAILEKECAKWE